MSAKIIFTHGIMGNSRIFEPLFSELSSLDAPCASQCITLPGHGGNALDFAHSSMTEWQAHLDEQLLAAQTQYDDVILVGHSMGGLLSVRSALTYPLHVRGLFLMALPLHMRMTYRYARTGMCVALGLRKDDPMVRAAADASGVDDSNLLHYALTAPRYVELFRKAADTRRIIPSVNVPLLAVQSARDDIVSMRSADVIESAGHEVCRLRESGHFLYTDAEKSVIRNRFRCFVDGCLSH